MVYLIENINFKIYEKFKKDQNCFVFNIQKFENILYFVIKGIVYMIMMYMNIKVQDLIMFQCVKKINYVLFLKNKGMIKFVN